MKISKRTILIGISTLVVAAGGLTYFLLSKDDPSVLGWMNNSWLYRKSITVANTGATLTNEDVLITIDTATLITASKLQNDCDDLRFTDSDESTTLSYWVEGGCNTSTTQVWVRIPSLTAGGKTIYMYYGNASATNAEESWSGVFVLLNTSDCPTGWTRNSDFDNRFIYGATTYGSTGGSSTHNHGQTSCTTGGPSATTTTESDSGTYTAATTHIHTNAVVDVDDQSNLPPYLDMLFCSNSELNIDTGLITLFTTTPENWTRFSALDDKFPTGALSYGGTGGAATHTHTTTGGYTTSVQDNLNEDSSGTSRGAGPHTHITLNGTTGAASSIPPYYDMVFASKDSAGYANSGLISITTGTPPLGWTRFTNLDGKFLRGATTSGGTGGTTTHTHSVSIYTNNGNASNRSSGTRITSAAATSHSHSCSTNTTSASQLPSYIETTFYQRKTSVATTLGDEVTLNTVPNAPSTLKTEAQTNPTGVTDTTPEFSALFSDPDSSDTGNYYQVQVNTTSGFDGTTMWDSTKTAFSPVIVNGAQSSDIAYAGTTLEVGTTYYWRIKFWDNNSNFNESAWSATANFTMNAYPTAPTVPYCQGASNPIKVSSSTPTFSAIFNDPDSSDTGTYYQIEVNTASDFSGTTMWDSTKTSITAIANGARSGNITYSGSTLNEGETYYWRIKFWDNNDHEGVLSTVAQFIMSGIPDIPTNLKTNGVSNPTMLTSVPPFFTAYYSDPNQDSASAYEIEVNTNSLFTGTVMWDSGKTSTTILNGQTSSPYTYDGTSMSNSGNVLYWRIRFWDTDDSVSEWSATAQFTDTYSSFKFTGVGLDGLKLD